MKVICDICKREFEYPIEQMHHRHRDVELDLVPPNFWKIKDYLPEFEIKISDDGKVILPKFRKTSSLKAGNTPLIQYLPNVFLKDESVNPTGSFKDRGMDSIMNEILMHGKDKVSVVSCGSGAIAIINYAKEYGIKSLAFIHEGISKASLRLISNADEVFYSSTFIKSYEDFMQYSLTHSSDVFCGFLNTNISYMLGLRSMSYEIVCDLGHAPDIVFIPCGSGMDILAQNLAFREMYDAGVISKIPKIGVVELAGGNPIAQGYAKGVNDYLYVIDEPVESKTILSNDTCFNYKKIFDMVSRNEAFFVSVSDDEIDDFILTHPDFERKYDYTSLSVMAAVKKYGRHNDDETIVAVITCKNRMEV